MDVSFTIYLFLPPEEEEDAVRVPTTRVYVIYPNVIRSRSKPIRVITAASRARPKSKSTLRGLRVRVVFLTSVRDDLK